MVSTPTPSAEVVVRFVPKGGALKLFLAREPELLIEGPAGTGKTRGVLELLHLLALKYPGMRGLITRKYGTTLTTTCLVTFNEKVLHKGDGVTFFGGSKHEPAAYRYANGSRIVVGGLDNSDKIFSSEYDVVYVNEATEVSVIDWENLTTRLRNGVLEHARIIGDCNPTHDKHWLYQREKAGQVRVIKSFLEDNPRYFNEDGTMTEEGAEYIGKLDRLTGQRYQRFRLGLRVGAENAVYPHFNPDIHIVELTPDIRWSDGAFGADYGRVHRAASVPITVDQFNRRWVREAWGEPDLEHGNLTAKEVGRQWRQYNLRRGRVDPNQDVLIGLLGEHRIHTAHLAEGPRQTRINIASHYFQVFQGGRATSYRDELKDTLPNGPYTEPDSPGLLLVKGAPGIDDLAEQIPAYHYIHQITETKDVMTVARIDEDLIAAMEYGLEELESKGPEPISTQGRVNYGRSGAGQSWGMKSL